MAQSRIKKPVFLIGMPRSGTSIVYEALIQHEAMAWPPHYLRLMPAFPEICVINRLFPRSGAKQQRGKISFFRKLIPRPDEMYPMWEYLVGERFLYSFLREAKPTSAQIEHTRRYLHRLARAEGKHRLAAKLTGPPRMQFLAGIFPDALFIEIRRDPRAVVASLFQVDFWRNRSGLDQPFWTDALSADQLDQCKKEPHRAAALAAFQYLAVCQQTETEKSVLTNPFMEIRYEEFVERPAATIQRILEFSDLPASPKIDQYTAARHYKNMNGRYKQILTADDIKTVERICKPLL